MSTTKIQPGGDLHLTLLMAPHSLNLVTGADRAALLAYGRDVFAAGQAGAASAAVAGPAWDKTRDSLAALLLGLSRHAFLDFDVARIALDSATEPGMPMAYMRGAAAAPALAAPAAPPPRTTGYIAPKGRYVPPVLFNPYTGEPRDARDIASDPQGVLIVPPGADLLAAAPQAPAAADELRQIAAIAACWGCDHPDEPGDTEVVRRVKWAARQLRAAQAPAAPALSAAPIPVMPRAITAGLGLDDSGEEPAYCVMVAFRQEDDARYALSILSAGLGATAAPATGNWIAAEEVDRLVRDLDVALHGEADAAPQASLCDIVGLAKAAAGKLGRPVLAAPAAPAVDAPEPASEWRDIFTAEKSDDLIWLYDANSKTIDGPRTFGTYDVEEYTHWAPAEAPDLDGVDEAFVSELAAQAQQKGPAS